MKQTIQMSVILFVFVIGAISFGANPLVVMETNFGNITYELYPDDAPITVDNFLSYVNNGFYDGLLFHRAETRGRAVSDGSYIYTGALDVIQGGGYYLDGTTIYQHPPSSDPIVNESDNGLSNLRGTIAMARTSDPDSATSQFFINHQDNIDLDRDYPNSDGYGYCVFGYIVDGMDVVDSIAQTNIIAVSGFSYSFPYNPTVDIIRAYEIPEPTTLLLLGMGGLALRIRRH